MILLYISANNMIIAAAFLVILLSGVIHDCLTTGKCSRFCIWTKPTWMSNSRDMETITIRQRRSTRTFSLKTWLNRKNERNSALLGELVTNSQTLKVNNALLAFFLFVVSAGNISFWAIPALLYFVYSATLCILAFREDET